MPRNQVKKEKKKKTEIKNTEMWKNINHIILITKFAISKFRFRKCKNLELIFDTELQTRHQNAQ